jgi:hypothetical protein
VRVVDHGRSEKISASDEQGTSLTKAEMNMICAEAWNNGKGKALQVSDEVAVSEDFIEMMHSRKSLRYKKKIYWMMITIVFSTICSI